MTIVSRSSGYVKDERGLLMITGSRDYVVVCFGCGKDVRVSSSDGIWSSTLEPHGMTVLLRPDGVEHICVEHLE